MTPLRSLRSSALLLAWVGWLASSAPAAAGDVFVPAHRTRDGSYVPPNVAPLSSGSHLARRPTQGRYAKQSQASTGPAAASPLFVQAASIRR